MPQPRSKFDQLVMLAAWGSYATLSACGSEADPVSNRAAVPEAGAPVLSDPVDQNDAISAPERPEDNAAMKLVFGSERGGVISVDGKPVEYRNGRTTNFKDFLILIAGGKVYQSAHPDPGFLGIWYLKPSQKGMRVVRSAPNIVKLGTFGEAPDWKMRTDLWRSPVIEAEGFGMWFGHTYKCVSLVTLTDSGPKILLHSILTQYQFDPGDDPAELEPATLIEGSVTYDRSKDLFEVKYRGSEKRDLIYAFNGKTYQKIRGKMPSKHC